MGIIGAAIPDFSYVDSRLWHYRAFVMRVANGDTLEVLVDQGFGSYSRQRIRLLGVDAPEMRPRKGSPDERNAEKLAALRTIDRVVSLVGRREVVIRTEKLGKLAVVFLPDDVLKQLGRDNDPRRRVSLNDLLLEEGLASPFPNK